MQPCPLQLLMAQRKESVEKDIPRDRTVDEQCEYVVTIYLNRVITKYYLLSLVRLTVQ